MKKKDKNKNPFAQPTESELIDRYVDSLSEKDKKNRTIKYKPRYKRRRRFVMPVLLSIILLATVVFGLFYFDVIPSDFIKTADSSDQSAADPFFDKDNDLEVIAPDDDAENEQTDTPVATRPSRLIGTTLELDKDFTLATVENDFASISADAESHGITALYLKFNVSQGLITDTEEGLVAINKAAETAHQKALALYATVDISALCDGDITLKENALNINQKLAYLGGISGIDGIMITGAVRQSANTDFADYIATGTLGGFEDYKKSRLTNLVRSMSESVRGMDGSKLFGLITDPVYATKDEMEGGMDLKSEKSLLKQDADVIDWMQNNYFDIVFINADTTTTSTDRPFERVVNWWHQNAPANCDIGFMLYSDLAIDGKGIWKNPDQLGRQIKILSDINRFVFCFNSNSALKNDTSGAAELVYKYLTGGIADDYIMRELSITSPKKHSFTTYENSVAIIGASDPNFELLLNDKPVERTADGYFSLQIDLKVGKNTLVFSHKGSSQTFNITYRYVVIKDYSPTSAVKLDGGSTIIVNVTARTGSTVKATLNGETVKLEMVESEEYSDFSKYTGGITLPAAEKKAKDIGKIKFTGTHNGVTESFSGGKVTVNKKPDEVSYTPSTGGYIGVGNTLIAEVTKYQVETFDGDKVNDLSQPYNAYLPKGTLDYCSENTIVDPASGHSYRLLRYGKRVYTTKSGVANIRTLRGSLPETNKLSVKSFETQGQYTVFTLKTDWKAPFKLELLPQKYAAATGSERGTITAATFNYIDITFCYSSKFDGLPENIADSPVFSKAQLIKNTDDYTLRLYLKKTGAFYGWKADYDSNGNLVFKFLNPAKATKADNEYGGRLDGITIVIDPGHGGSDPGAVGAVNKPALTEANRSLLLAQKIEKKLKSIGANVVMTRSTDSSLQPDERILRLKNANPHLGISVHRNAANSASANGFGAYYFNPYTKGLADCITTTTAASGTYKKSNTKWHVFYMSRISDCPVVLTENGFMSNSYDFGNMKEDKWNDECADAIVKGVVDYFLSIE